MFRYFRTLFVGSALLTLTLAACAAPAEEPAEAPVAEEEAPAAEQEMPASEIDLEVVKSYAQEHAAGQTESAAALAETADTYYALVESYDFDYEAAFEADSEQLSDLIETAREQWKEASNHYELAEGIVAGVGELADFDVWIDAGPSAEEAPDEAYIWTLELPDGRTLESPGNIYHYLLEPTLYGTNSDFVGADADLDGDGEVVFTEALPEANIFKGSADALHAASMEMEAAIDAWEPSVEDAFTLLVVMTPTMSEYFEQWKLSAFIAGSASEEESFVALSRLFDITHILNGLNLTYDTIDPLVASEDADLNDQIQTGYDDLTGFVGELYDREQSGEVFSPEEADLLGTEAQSQAEAVAALVAQAAGAVGVTIEE